MRSQNCKLVQGKYRILFCLILKLNFNLVSSRRFLNHLKFLPVVLPPPTPPPFLYSYWFRFLLHLRVYLQMFLYVGATRSNEWVRELKKQIWWRATIGLNCVCIKSKSHGTYGLKSSFPCVMSAPFTYYSGSFVSLRQNSTQVVGLSH